MAEKIIGLVKFVLFENVNQEKVLNNKKLQIKKNGTKTIIAIPALQGPPCLPNWKMP